MSQVLKALTFGSGMLAASVVLAEVNDAEIENSHHEKAAGTQLLPWYQYYENVDVGIGNQLDIQNEAFAVTSPAGTATGHTVYQAAVKQFPASDRFAPVEQSRGATVEPFVIVE